MQHLPLILPFSAKFFTGRLDYTTVDLHMKCDHFKSNRYEIRRKFSKCRKWSTYIPGPRSFSSKFLRAS